MKLGSLLKKPEGQSAQTDKKWIKPKAGIAVVLVAAVGLFGVSRLMGGRGQQMPEVDAAYTTAAVERRDITASITGSGTLQAANSYSVTTLVEGNILSADFEEGDQVEKGTVLYTIDSSDADDSLEQAQLSLEQAQRSYQRKLETLEELNITAPCEGQVIALEVEVGDEVKQSQLIATVRNSAVMCLEVPFPSDDAAGFFVGQSAQVTLDSTFETLSGTVTKISGYDTVLTGNRIVRYVTVEVNNPGALSTTQTASVTIDGAGSSSGASFTYKNEQSVSAGVAGEVVSVAVREGSMVSKGQSLVQLQSDSLEDEIQNAEDSLRNAERSLESRYEQLEDYTISSPIQGTIIDKNYKAGETSESNQVLCTIYDLSYLTMTLSVDELDISKMEVGQTVTVTADAVEDRTYEGVVTKVSVAGTSTGSATTYPVTIRIDETNGLLPGMSVDAEIILSSAADVLTIPSAALMRGNQVLVTADSPSAANGTLMEGDNTEGYVVVTVEVGTGDDSYLEITSGLREGDTVAYIPTSSEDTFGMMMGGMPGGMGGGMPGGGGGMTSGGRPSGGPGGF